MTYQKDVVDSLVELIVQLVDDKDEFESILLSSKLSDEDIDSYMKRFT